MFRDFEIIEFVEAMVPSMVILRSLIVCAVFVGSRRDGARKIAVLGGSGE